MLEYIRSANSLPSGFWNEEGCELVVTRRVITCQCDHLTHFGILLSPRSETVREREGRERGR